MLQALKTFRPRTSPSTGIRLTIRRMVAGSLKGCAPRIAAPAAPMPRVVEPRLEARAGAKRNPSTVLARLMESAKLMRRVDSAPSFGAGPATPPSEEHRNRDGRKAQQRLQHDPEADDHRAAVVPCDPLKVLLARGRLLEASPPPLKERVPEKRRNAGAGDGECGGNRASPHPVRGEHQHGRDDDEAEIHLPQQGAALVEKAQKLRGMLDENRMHG